MQITVLPTAAATLSCSQMTLSSMMYLSSTLIDPAYETCSHLPCLGRLLTLPLSWLHSFADFASPILFAYSGLKARSASMGKAADRGSDGGSSAPYHFLPYLDYSMHAACLSWMWGSMGATPIYSMMILDRSGPHWHPEVRIVHHN